MARLMGFDLMQNFRRPYLARSVSDFWRRWHISLSTWFRDYVYISLGGNRKGLPRQVFNLLLVFVLSGLWHGANWTFAIWGIYHGAIVAIETVLRACQVRLVPRNALGHMIKLLCAFVFVYIGWILFRANRIEDIEYILRHISDFSEGFAGLTDPFSAGLLPQRLEFFISFVLIGFLLVVDVVDEHAGINFHFARLPVLWRWIVYYLFLIAIYISLFYQATKQEFIYFQC
ncbi:MAG: MBOAT family protein [Chloroflexi bacterium]|nr:MBOAT family protein [Chloroflexota bacterium]